MSFVEKFAVCTHDEAFEKKLSKELVGRRIVEIDKQSDQIGYLILDNGTRLKLVGNEGCGGCGNGWYYLDELNTCSNVITSVTLGCEQPGESWGEEYGVYRLYVFAENEKICAASYSGGDNGYYGEGFSVHVEVETPKVILRRRRK